MLYYSSIGSKSLTMALPLSELSSRDKVALFNDLMDQLGITARLNAESDATKRFQEIWQEQCNEYWDKRV